jgi:hypothetical protein
MSRVSVTTLTIHHGGQNTWKVKVVSACPVLKVQYETV